MIKHSSTKYLLLNIIGRYGAVGTFLNLIGLLAFIGLVHMGIAANIALLCVSISLFPLSYVFNKAFVFNLESDSTRSRSRFFITYSLIFLINYSALDILLSRTSLSAIYAQILIFILLVSMNFAVQLKWVFKDRNSHSQ